MLNPENINAQKETDPKNSWKLVWQDEFNGTRLDTGKWNVLIRENSKHGELQYYVPDEVSVNNGVLRISSRIRKYGSKQFTSRRLDTHWNGNPILFVGLLMEISFMQRQTESPINRIILS